MPHQKNIDLPQPDHAAQELSQHMINQIRQEIQQNGGRLPFDRFMELALYAPGLGYYVAGARKFGATGDFVTAPEISPVFAQCLARQCQQILAVLGGGGILEFGAGSGVLAADLLEELERLDSLPERYLILELSPELQQRQRLLLEQRVPGLMDRIEWLNGMPDPGFRGVMLANEVLDAMPVHRFRLENGRKIQVSGVQGELYVTYEIGGLL